MAYVIAEPCVNTKDTACVEVCPVDCIHPKKDEAARRVGELVMTLVRHDIRPRSLLTKESFENAIASVSATGGSTNGSRAGSTVTPAIALGSTRPSSVIVQVAVCASARAIVPPAQGVENEAE